MKSVILIATMMVAASQAAFLACDFGFSTTFIKGFAQGFQQDIDSQSTDCYKQSGKVAQQSDSLLRSGAEFSAGKWMRPVQRFNEFLIELTNQFETCKTTDFAKQLVVRTSSWAGGIDLVVTIGMGILMKSVPGSDATS